MKKTKSTIAFGDFQTPLPLAQQVVNFLDKKSLNFELIIEPSCGLGNFIKAILASDKNYDKEIIGWDINKDYIECLKQDTSKYSQVKIDRQDFFSLNWNSLNYTLQKPTLFIGNPPWVTNTELAKLNSKNIPNKSNFHNYQGLDAITGKSNFDISESMLIKILNFISGSESSMAFLIKTSVARKLYAYICKNELAISEISIYKIDAWKYFQVNVSACLFFAQGNSYHIKNLLCPVYNSLNETIPNHNIGFINQKLIANITMYQKLIDIDKGCEFKWRSGIKHDCNKVMEFELREGNFKNGFDEQVNLENTYVYPMYKSSDIAKNNLILPRKYLLVTQQKIGDNTSNISILAPKTWSYLQKYAYLLDSRKSSIYKSAPQFAIFGVGEYTFKPFKIAISSLYKNLHFTKVSCFNNKPIVLDDTCYMLSFDYEYQADFVLSLLSSEIAKNFIKSLIFEDNKRLITASLLNRINLEAIALYLGKEKEYNECFKKEKIVQYSLF